MLEGSLIFEFELYFKRLEDVLLKLFMLNNFTSPVDKFFNLKFPSLSSPTFSNYSPLITNIYFLDVTV